jgi:hypothetical protein
MDFITDLPACNGYDTIFVIVDLFSKAAYFRPTTKTCTSEQLADLFLRTFYGQHLLPDVIVSDRDPRITAAFQSIFSRLGTKFNTSSAYHPQTDGQTERTIRTFQQILRVYVGPGHDNWCDCLPIAEGAYNSSVSSSTGVSPFTAVYGREPRTPTTAALPATAPSDNDDYLTRLVSTHASVHANLEKAKAQQSAQADAHRRPLTFAVGDRVRLSTENITLRDQPSKKFKDRYIGPFTVAQVISPVVYRLTLPPSHGRLHPVFHVSMLQPWHDDDEHPSRTQPERPPPAVPEYVYDGFLVDRLLDVKIGKDPRYPRSQALLFLVSWAPPYDSEDKRTWEPYRNVAKLDALREFLSSPTWSAFRAKPAYAAFRRKYPSKLPSLPEWLPPPAAESAA